MDKTLLIYSAILTSSIVLQSFLILKKKIFSWFFLISLIFPLFAFMQDDEELVYDLQYHIFLYNFLLVFCIALYYRKYILASLSESLILQLAIILIYGFFASGQKPGYIILLLPIIPVLLIGVFSNVIFNTLSKFIIYLWFLLTSAILTIVQASHSDIKIIYLNTDETLALNNETALQIFFGGFVFFPILVSLIILLSLIPLPGKRQTFRDRLITVKEDIRSITENFKDHQLKSIETLLIIIVQSSLLIANYYFKVLDPFIAISISLFIVQLIVYYKFNLNGLMALFLNLFRKHHSTI